MWHAEISVKTGGYEMTRIQQIINSGKFITCPNCHKSYLPMNDAAEVICPLCDRELDAMLELELLEIEALENREDDHE
jgi:uncharacterized Zn-finger protein